MCLPIVAKKRPTLPSILQLERTILPPGRRTRAISEAACLWSGANMTPNTDSTASKLSSSKGSASASPSTHSISSPSASASRLPASSSEGVRSSPVTWAPLRAAGRVAFPEPQATSSTSSSPLSFARSAVSSPAELISFATAGKSPASHVSLARCFTSDSSGVI